MVDAYPCRIDGHAAQVLVNLALRLRAPDPELPWLAYTAVELLRPDPHGMPDEDEAEDLTDLQEMLTATFEEHRATFAGAILTRGRCEFYFYAEEVLKLEEVIEPVAHEFDEYTFSVGTHEDPVWTHYIGVLIPDGSVVGEDPPN